VFINPFRALRRVFQGGMAYWRAWRIALAAPAISFTGLIAFGVGFYGLGSGFGFGQQREAMFRVEAEGRLDFHRLDASFGIGDADVRIRFDKIECKAVAVEVH
jgi:hypothetical protein